VKVIARQISDRIAQVKRERERKLAADAALQLLAGAVVIQPQGQGLQDAPPSAGAVPGHPFTIVGGGHVPGDVMNITGAGSQGKFRLICPFILSCFGHKNTPE